jgi:hypothetical protein
MKSYRNKKAEESAKSMVDEAIEAKQAHLRRQAEARKS